jgi:glycosyltransferase involved in cell wall biosynthesis
LLGQDRKDHFVGIWVNRNAKRKRPSDVLLSWKKFLDRLELEHGHKKATLIMHTEPTDNEGPNLFKVSEMLEIQDSVFFSRDRINFEQMNVLYNISDFCINISYAEGFGLGTLESMMTGTPIIAAKTGGMTRQVIDYRDETENGVGLEVVNRALVGSQSVPYIYEDYVSCDDAADAMYKLFNMSDYEKSMLSEKVLSYATNEFCLQKTIDAWHETMLSTMKNFKTNKFKAKNFTVNEY